MFEIDLAGLDLGVIQQLLDQRQQRVAGGLLPPWHRSSAPASAASPIANPSARCRQRRADFVAGHREKARLGAVGGVSLVAGFGRVRVRLSWRSVSRGRRSAFRQAGAPASIEPDLRAGDPARPTAVAIFWVVNSCAVRLKGGVALLQHGERKAAADQGAARLPASSQ